MNQGGTEKMESARDVDRTVLPIPDVPYAGELPFDAKDPAATFPPIQELRPPAGAPNVLVILLDDVGFGAASTFGGPCETPNADRLAERGLRYNRFHTTALCAPTRAALLTGRNHHSVGMASITELATSAPGYTSLRPNSKAPLAETLKLNGYSTAQFGKCHEVPVFQNSPLGPFDMWPTGSGFEHFYGFIGGEDNQYYPSLYEGTTPVEVDKTPEEGYHLTEDLADHAIAWMRTQKSLVADRPFFVYFAPGATHSPHHVPKEWIDRYKGRFAHGWDRQREITFARQKELGVIPADAELTRRHDEIPAWNEMPEALKPVLERQMETYAAFLSHTDHQVGRLIDTLDDLGILDDTLVYCIIGDNGASAEGSLQGAFNELIHLNGMGDVIETPEFLAARIDDWGTPQAYNHYAVGWAWAMGAPFQWTKQVASHWGWHPQRHDRPLAEHDPGRGRPSLAVLPRDRYRADRARGGRHPGADDGERCHAEPLRGHEHGLHVRCGRRARAPRRPVLRDVRQPRDLPQGMERGDEAPHAVEARGRDEDAFLRRGCLGAVRRQHGLQPGA
jgi:arylsulfatase